MKQLTLIDGASRSLYSLGYATVLSLFMASLGFAADTVIYKSIAEDGSVVFTDEPSDNAQSFKPAELNVVTPPEKPTKTNNENRAKAEAALKALTVNYVRIQSPSTDQTFVNPVGTIPVSITTGHEGTLPVGHKAQILLDGKVVSTGSGFNYSIPAPHRGTHTISARVFNASGKLRARSRVVKINVIKSVVGGGN